jgi:uncharacterized SAM-binding protein YcdF (DUF218 family)
MTKPRGYFPDARPFERGGIFFRLLFLVFLVVFFFGIYLIRHPLLRLAGSVWVVDQSPQTSDAIVILGDDNYNGDRATRAAELFKAGWAPRVVASGRYLRPYASVAELEAHDLSDRGVPTTAVVRLAHRAADTREECVEISRLLSSHGWKRVLLVTSNYHTRHSRYICARLFPSGTVLQVVAARDSEYDPEKWWWNRAGVKIFFHESVGMLVALWEMRRDKVHTVETGLFDRVLTLSSLPRIPS